MRFLARLLSGCRLCQHWEVGSGGATGTALGVSHFEFSQDFTVEVVVHHEVDHGLAEVSADGAHHLHVEVLAGIDAAIGPHKTDLERVGVDQVEFAPHDLAPARLLAFLNCEAAPLKTKHVLLLLEQHWEYFFFVPVLHFRLIISEHECVPPD